MDPNANLEEQEELLQENNHHLDCLARERDLKLRYSSEEREYMRGEVKGNAARLRELRLALNGWLIRGGFQPDWQKYPTVAKYYGRTRS